MRSIHFKNWTLIFLLLSLLLIIFSVIKIKSYSQFLSYMVTPNCFDWEISGWTIFKPNCIESFKVEGREVEYSINQIGLRERSFTKFKKKQLVLLGDSTIEGMGLKIEETIGQEFERKLKSDTNLQFLNLGIRRAGTLQEAYILKKYLPILKPSFILWSLTENDFNDDYLSAIRTTRFDSNGLPIQKKFLASTIFPNSVFTNLILSLDIKNNDYNSIIRHLYLAKKVYKMIEPWSYSPAICNGIHLGYKLAEENNIKIQFLIVPFGPNYYSLFEEGNLKEKMDRVVACLKNKPIDLRVPEIQDNPKLFQEDLMHLNYSGVQLAVSLIKDDVLEFIKDER
jgi:lysophospholipase L1-like esterase